MCVINDRFVSRDIPGLDFSLHGESIAPDSNNGNIKSSTNMLDAGSDKAVLATTTSKSLDASTHGVNVTAALARNTSVQGGSGGCSLDSSTRDTRAYSAFGIAEGSV